MAQPRPFTNCSKHVRFLPAYFGSLYFRVGVANFISLLIQKVNADIKPFTAMLLKPLFHAVLEEKSSAAKRAFAAACAITLKYAGASQTQKIIDDTAMLHLGDRNAQISCAIQLKNFLNIAADVLSGYHAVVLPVIFVARYEFWLRGSTVHVDSF